MHNLKTRCWLLGLLLSFLGNGPDLLAQELPTSVPGVQLRLKDLPGEAAPRKQLYTVVKGKEYPIDRLDLSRGIARLDGYEPDSGKPAWFVDAAGTSLYYTALTGCGWENDGMVILRSDLYGKRVEPLLGSCDNLAMESLSGAGKQYLLVREGNSGIGDTGFWIFDLATSQPLVHARGTLAAKANGFQYCDGNEDQPGMCRQISLETLLNRKAPLLLRPRFPLTARTVADGVELRQSEGSEPCGTSPTVGMGKVPQKGSLVVILDTCKERGVYEVFYRGIRGTVSKSQLTGFNIK